MKEFLYICVKNPFCERDMERMGVEVLESHFDVRILDCTAWLMPQAYATRGQSTLLRHNLRSIKSLNDFRAELAGKHGGFALDYVGPFSVQAVLLFNELKSKEVKLIVVDSGAYPSPDSTLGKRSFIKKVSDAFIHGGLRQHITAKVIKLLLKILPDQTPDFALVSGTSWQSEPRFVNAHIKIPAHSFDYENYLKVKTKPPVFDYPYALYLDEVIAGHEDNEELGFSEPASADCFYPALDKFFDGFEKIAGLPVVIAGYPSNNRDRRSCFGRREVVLGKTAELIRDAELVFAHASTAISYAVIWRRPIVFLTSKEIMGSWYQSWIEAPQKLLAAQMVNIDNAKGQIDPSLWRLVNENKYECYEETYIRAKGGHDGTLWEKLLAVKSSQTRLVQSFQSR